MNTLCVLYAVVFLAQYEQAVSRHARGHQSHNPSDPPGCRETTDDIRASVRYLAAHPVFGVKLQLLHVLEGTDLGTLYKNDPFSTFYAGGILRPYRRLPCPPSAGNGHSPSDR